MTESRTQPDKQAVHLYQLKGWNEATWLVETREVPGGPGLNVAGDRTRP